MIKNLYKIKLYNNIYYLIYNKILEFFKLGNKRELNHRIVANLNLTKRLYLFLQFLFY